MENKFTLTIEENQDITIVIVLTDKWNIEPRCRLFFWRRIYGCVDFNICIWYTLVNRTVIEMDTTNGFTNQVNEENRSPPDYLYYAVGENRVNSIWTDGLYAKGNRYVHLSNNAETALRIGRIYGKPHVFKIRSGEMYRRGFKFYLSENGVWMTKRVPVQFISDDLT